MENIKYKYLKSQSFHSTTGVTHNKMLSNNKSVNMCTTGIITDTTVPVNVHENDTKCSMSLFYRTANIETISITACKIASKLQAACIKDENSM